jgi:hypothetical protein
MEYFVTQINDDSFAGIINAYYDFNIVWFL